MIFLPKIDRWMVFAIGGIAFGVAAMMFLDYARSPDDLWRDALTDRNGYLASGMTYAGAWRSFNLFEIIVHTARSTIWPPVHGILLGFVLLPWMDYRLGPIVSLTGWWMTVVISALIARRLCRDPFSGVIAAALTAIFVMASPAFRLLGSDVMLEGLGAGLSALALLLYLRGMERPDEAARWRWLALVLTLLFFEKYNYWAMLVATLAVAFVAERPGLVLAKLRDWSAGIAPRSVLSAGLRDPLLIAGLLTGGLVAVFYALKPAPIVVFGKAVGIYPPENLTTLAYALLFIRLALLWRRHRAAFASNLGPILQTLVYWHVVPVLVSFLIPKRLSGFAWFLSANNNPAGTGSHPMQSAMFQWPGFADGFHVAAWSALLVVSLAVVGGSKIVRLPTGSRAVALFPLICACALLSHPQQQWRFQTTWLFGVWICAGVGGAMVLTFALSRLRPQIRIAAAASVIAAVGAAHLAQPVSVLAGTAAIRRNAGPSDLEFARAYLPHIQGQTPVGFMTSFGRSDFFTWTVRSDCGCDRQVDAPFNGASYNEARGYAEIWLARTAAEHIVVVDVPGVHEMPEIGMTAAVRRGALDLMQIQTRFARVIDVPVPPFAATVSIWRRK